MKQRVKEALDSWTSHQVFPPRFDIKKWRDIENVVKKWRGIENIEFSKTDVESILDYVLKYRRRPKFGKKINWKLHLEGKTLKETVIGYLKLKRKMSNHEIFSRIYMRFWLYRVDQQHLKKKILSSIRHERWVMKHE